MEKLKVGDKIYNKKNDRYSTFVDYKICEVIRLTKTQAILSNGDKIINEPIADYSKKDLVCFSEYGDRWTKWYFLTNEIITEVNLENRRKKIYCWFRDKKFTEQEMEQVYNLLNQ